MLIYHFISCINSEFSTVVSLSAQCVISIVNSYEVLQLFVELNDSVHLRIVQASFKYQFPTLRGPHFSYRLCCVELEKIYQEINPSKLYSPTS
uniref:Putative ovule protein n=1 Tax=Solanum chacoense TaxID=4108 RepID=A0A0V0H363_SOLCH